MDGFGQAKRDASGNVWIITHLVAEHYTPAQQVEGKVGIPKVKLLATVACLDPQAYFKMDINFAKSRRTTTMFPFYSQAKGHNKLAEVLSWYCTLRLGNASKIVETDNEDFQVRVITNEGFRTKAKARLQVTIDIYNHNHNDSMHYIIQVLLEYFREAEFTTLPNPADELQGMIEHKPADDKGENLQMTQVDLAFKKNWLENCWQPALDQYSKGLKSRCRSAIDDMQEHRGCAKKTLCYSASVCIAELLEMLDSVK